MRKTNIDFFETLTVGNETKTISGLVIPTDWDENGTVLGASIFDRKERQFVIEQNQIGKQLLSLVHEDVEIQATIKKVRGRDVAEVKNFWLRTGGDKREDELILSGRR
jgi:hypothetical protein